MFSFCKINPEVLTASINDKEVGTEFFHARDKFPIIVFLVPIRVMYEAAGYM